MSWEGHGIKNRSGKTWNWYGISVGRLDIFLLATRIFFSSPFYNMPEFEIINLCYTPF